VLIKNIIFIMVTVDFGNMANLAAYLALRVCRVAGGVGAVLAGLVGETTVG
jgi:hypothetical protein